MLHGGGAEFPRAADHAADTVALVTVLLPAVALVGAGVARAEDRTATDARPLAGLTQQHGARGLAVLVTLTQVTALVLPLFVRRARDCGGGGGGDRLGWKKADMISTWKLYGTTCLTYS